MTVSYETIVAPTEFDNKDYSSKFLPDNPEFQIDMQKTRDSIRGSLYDKARTVLQNITLPDFK